MREDGPKLVRFPAPDKIGAREALQRAMDDDLTNVIILSQRENGDIYHIESDYLTLATVNLIIDSFKWWFWKQTDKG